MSLGQFVKLAVHFQLQFFVARGSNSKKVNKETHKSGQVHSAMLTQMVMIVSVKSHCTDEHFLYDFYATNEN